MDDVQTELTELLHTFLADWLDRLVLIPGQLKTDGDLELSALAVERIQRLVTADLNQATPEIRDTIALLAKTILVICTPKDLIQRYLREQPEDDSFTIHDRNYFLGT